MYLVEVFSIGDICSGSYTETPPCVLSDFLDVSERVQLLDECITRLNFEKSFLLDYLKSCD